MADGWSLYGGALADKHYQSAAMGVGRDLAQFGALAFDVTHSHVNLDHDSAYGKGKLDGNSFRVSYAKTLTNSTAASPLQATVFLKRTS